MKKTYKTFNGENRNSFFKVGKDLVRVRFTPTYTTDNEFVQNAIEDTHAFKIGEIQLVTSSMTWIKIDRDENGFATEECLRKIESYYEKEIPVAIAYVSYGTYYDVITPSSDIQEWLADIHNSAKYTHYLPMPIPKLVV